MGVMLEIRGLPQSSEELLGLISKAELSKKYVWTPGRVVKEAAFQAQLAGLRWEHRKEILKRLRDLLEDLASQGILERRQFRQSVRLGNEIAYDYIRHSSLAPAPTPKQDL